MFYDTDAYRKYYGKLVDDKDHHARVNKIMVKDSQTIFIVDYSKSVSRPNSAHSINIISSVDADTFADSIKEFLTVKPSEVIIADSEVWVKPIRKWFVLKRGAIWFGLDKVVGHDLSDNIYGDHLQVYDYYYDFVHDRVNLILNR